MPDSLELVASGVQYHLLGCCGIIPYPHEQILPANSKTLDITALAFYTHHQTILQSTRECQKSVASRGHGKGEMVAEAQAEMKDSRAA